MNTKIIRRSVPDNWRTLFPDSHPVLAKVYAARQLQSADELEQTLNRLQSLNDLMGAEQAALTLATAIELGQRIIVIGDFDADGATSTAVALRALRLFGATDVHFLVPNRFEYGYGLTPEIVNEAAKLKPDLIVTVDNGIASLDGVAAANALCIKVIVTDHHLPGAMLPAAAAIVNPNQPGCTFAAKNLAGVGVIFYLMLALRAQLKECGWFAQQKLEVPNLAQLLDLVALGTVADVVTLDQSNRILVAQGLARIRSGHCCPGIAALLAVAGRNRERVVAADLGFAAGPRLNAAGRLEDMSLGIQCLLTDDPAEAQVLAGELDMLNRERRSIESEMQLQAMAELEALHLQEDALPTGLCLFQEQWHQGVIGILASRIKERYHRPVIAFAVVDDETIKGSARSVPGFHIRDALDAIATRFPGLITKFGGHAMAAGLSLERARLDEFKVAFDDEAKRHLSAEDLQGLILSDGELMPDEFGIELAESLRHAGPWGQGFPEPIFDGRFALISRRIVGERHLKMRLKPLRSEQTIDAIAFNTVDSGWPADVQQLRLAYKLDVNEFRGLRSVQLLVDHLEII